MAIYWKNKKEIAMHIPIHHSQLFDAGCYETGGCEYNLTMGGMDKVDQLLVDYFITRKQRKKY